LTTARLRAEGSPAPDRIKGVGLGLDEGEKKAGNCGCKARARRARPLRSHNRS